MPIWKQIRIAPSDTKLVYLHCRVISHILTDVYFVGSTYVK